MRKQAETNNPILILGSTSLAAWLAVKFSMPSPFMCIITCYVLTNIYAHELYLKSSERLFGALLGVCGLNLITLLGTQHLLVQQSLFMLLILICFYLHFLRFRAYAMLIAAVVLAFSMATELVASEHAALILGDSWTLDVLLGCIIAVFMNLFVKIWQDYGRVAPIDNLRAEVQLFRAALRFPRSIKRTVSWNKIAFFKSIRIMVIFFIIVGINQIIGLAGLTVQALIGAAVVSVQLSFEHSHGKFMQRVIGAASGAILALLTLYFIEHFELQMYWLWVIEAWLSILLFFMWLQPQRQYMYFQTGLLVIMLLTGLDGQQAQDLDIAWQRAIGNIEGGIISLTLIYLTDKYLSNLSSA